MMHDWLAIASLVRVRGSFVDDVATGLHCAHALKKHEVAQVISFTRPPSRLFPPPPFFLRGRGRPGNEAR